ncbi:type VI secretion system baseplate subunit TssE [Limobrevibacterium gyesilva]|uniref:Type VI secretion system baseplate subunit TssE n=1 Tax=Limobrevibacterium gyesilva TaxID=2991712 RepID=A0AA41YI30_9PROT|nr:type VI secretion system baseplate subunit TssE [Limobrevibacterium gyesilva]MCW3473894.1 type VI secretion system baseplate subunit TssE [Limobrevibacterium gyesilva]
MSGRTFRDGRGIDNGRGPGPRAQLPLLDRLIDDAPDQERDPPMSGTEAMAILRRSVRRDLEALLNARRRWKSWPTSLGELDVSAVSFGIPDYTSGTFNDEKRREALRAEIEDIIRRFEPRFVSVRVSLIEGEDRLESTLRLRIEALLHAEPAPDPMTFDTMMDPTTADVVVKARDNV